MLIMINLNNFINIQQRKKMVFVIDVVPSTPLRHRGLGKIEEGKKIIHSQSFYFYNVFHW